MAQLVERSLPTPKIRSSKPDLGLILTTNCIVEKTKIKEKRPGMAHLKKKKKNLISHSYLVTLGKINQGQVRLGLGRLNLLFSLTRANL